MQTTKGAIVKDQLKTIREFFDSISVPYETLIAFEQLESMVGEQEPAAWGAFHESGRAVIYQDRATVESFDLDGTPVEPLYRGPVAQQPQADRKERLEAALSTVFGWKQPQAEAVPPDVARDAERYRWLRDGCCEGYPSGEGSRQKDAYLVITGYDDLYPMTLEQKDAAIDAAIAQQKGDQ